MPQIRDKKNKGTPTGWRFKNGAWRYKVPAAQRHLWDGKQLFTLGKTLPEAYETWTARIGTKGDVQTVAQLLEKYAAEVIPTKAPTTQTSYRQCLSPLIRVFGHMRLESITPQHIYAYYRKRVKKIQARHEIAVLSQAFTAAVEWGFIKYHPFMGQVRLPNARVNDPRVVTDKDVAAFNTIKPTRKKGGILAIQAYIRLAELTGLRKADMLSLRLENLQDDGIHVDTRKKKKALIIEWTPALRQAVDTALDVRPTTKSDYLFCNRRGEGFWKEETGTASGWDSIWQRAMAKAKRDGVITETFGTHDLRARAADRVEESHAQRLLAHADPRTTRKHYRRAATRVMPTE